jgi:hypothetical protein
MITDHHHHHHHHNHHNQVLDNLSAPLTLWSQCICCSVGCRVLFLNDTAYVSANYDNSCTALLGVSFSFCFFFNKSLYEQINYCNLNLGVYRLHQKFNSGTKGLTRGQKMALKAISKTSTLFKLNNLKQIYDNIYILHLEIHLRAIQNWEQFHYIWMQQKLFKAQVWLPLVWLDYRVPL